MNSKEWKLSLLALAAVSLLTACSDDKKKDPGSPYAGVWVLQENLQDYSSFRGELMDSKRDRFCRRVYDNVDRYGDESYQMRAILVQHTGEVFRYSPGVAPTDPGFRESYMIGSVGPDGRFSRSRLGPDGRVINHWDQGVDFGPYDLPAQTRMVLKGEILVVYTSTDILTYERHVQPVIDDYALNVTSCLSRYRETIVVEERRGCRMEGRRQICPHGNPDDRRRYNRPEQLPKDADPSLNRREGRRLPEDLN